MRIAQTAQTINIKTLIDHCKTLHDLVKENSVKRLNNLIDNHINAILLSNAPLSAQDTDLEELYDCMIDFKISIEKLQSRGSKRRVERFANLLSALIQISNEALEKQQVELDSHPTHYEPTIESEGYISIHHQYKAITMAQGFLDSKQHNMTEEDEGTLQDHLNSLNSNHHDTQQPNEHKKLFQQYTAACRIDHKLKDSYNTENYPNTLKTAYDELSPKIQKTLENDFLKLKNTLIAEGWFFKNGRFSPLCTHVDAWVMLACKTLISSNTSKSEKHSILKMAGIALSIKKHAITLHLRSKKNRNDISRDLSRLESDHRKRELDVQSDLVLVKNTITSHLESIQAERQRQLQERNERLHALVDAAINNFDRILIMHSHSNIVGALQNTLQAIASLDPCFDLLRQGTSVNDEQKQTLSIKFQRVILSCTQQLQHVISGKTIMTDDDINLFLSAIKAITEKLDSTGFTCTSSLLNNEAQTQINTLIHFSHDYPHSDFTQQCYNHLDKLKSGIKTLRDELNSINDQANRHIDSLTHRSHNRLFANNGNTLMRTHLVNIKHALKTTRDALSTQQQTLTQVNFTDNFTLVRFINQQNKEARTNVSGISKVIRNNDHEINSAESKSPIMEFIHQQTNRIINQWNSITRHILSIFSAQNPLFQRVTSAQACQQIKTSTSDSLNSPNQPIPIQSY